MEPNNKPNSIDFTDTQIAFAGKSDRELRRMAWLFRLMNYRFLVQVGSSIGLAAVKWNLPFARKLVEETIFHQFCGGRNLMECQKIVHQLYELQCATILDFGAEAKETDQDFDRTVAETKRAIDFADEKKSVPVVSAKITGLGRFALYEKIQAGHALTPDEMSELGRVYHRVEELCQYARDKKIGLMIDAEESWIQDVIDDLVMQMMEKFNGERPIVYNTYQLYRKDKLAHLHRDAERAMMKGFILGAKIVRGAYMIKERQRALELGYPSPIQDTKEHTDNAYNEALRFCVDHVDHIGSCNATHNLDSCRLLAEWIAEKSMPNNHSRLNFCQLYGMSDYITFNLASAGYNVAKYLPYGPVNEVMPYLIRRAQENTSITGEMSRELELIEREVKRRGI